MDRNRFSSLSSCSAMTSLDASRVLQVYLRSYNGGEEFIIEHRRVSRTGERWVRLSAGSLI